MYATHSDYLNDNKELSTGITLIREILEDFPKKLNLPEERLSYLKIYFNNKSDLKGSEGYFLTCFSESTGIVDQWRGYGNAGYGFALGISHSEIANYASKYDNVHFLKCIYNRDEQVKLITDTAERANNNYGHFSKSIGIQKDQPRIRNAINNYTFATTIAESALRIKHNAFKQEREWRLVVKHYYDESRVRTISEYVPKLNFRTASRGLIPYISLDLPCVSKIVVGPSPDQVGNARAVDILVKDRKKSMNHEINIKLEDIPYRE